MTQTLQYALPAAIHTQIFKRKTESKKAKNLSRTLSAEDMELIVGLESVNNELAYIHSRFDQTTDETLIDALTFELKAAGLRHKYYHNQIKAKGIVFGK
ncbi:MAG: DUF2508 family protein [Defluviitaleaceae bacterium]|nr:DUF2508 family protein [Defluviitaleaceae bacterium]